MEKLSKLRNVEPKKRRNNGWTIFRKRSQNCLPAYPTLPLVGKSQAVLWNWPKFAHHWANWGPCWKTILNLPTSSPIITLGGIIVDCFVKRFRICPPVGKLWTNLENGPQFSHELTHRYPWWANCGLFCETVPNLPTSGQTVDQFGKWSSICPPAYHRYPWWARPI